MDEKEERQQQKEIIKEAIKEWMDEKMRENYAHLGKYVFFAVVGGAFAALVYFSVRGGQWPAN
jgi:hypothetical protein